MANLCTQKGEVKEAIPSAICEWFYFEEAAAVWFSVFTSPTREYSYYPVLLNLRSTAFYKLYIAGPPHSQWWVFETVIEERLKCNR